MADSLTGLLRILNDDNFPFNTNASVGSFNNTGRGTQNISDSKNTGYMAGDGNGAFNQNHFGDVSNNKGYINTGTQNMKGLINSSGYTKGNGNGSIVFGGFDSSRNTRKKSSDSSRNTRKKSVDSSRNTEKKK